jgi:ABC-2 type transport system permease protein
MLGTFRSELFKMTTTRATKILLGFAVLVPVIIYILTLFFAFNEGGMGSPAIVNIASGAPLVALLLGVVGVMCATQEYSQGTIRITLVATPNRSRVYVAKLLTTLFISVISTAIVLLTSLIATQLILSSRGVRFELIGNDARVVASFLLMTTIVSVFGFSLGLIFKSGPGAISSVLLWPTIAEGMVFGLLSVATQKNFFRWAPIQNGFQLVSEFQMEDNNSWSVSLLLFSGFVAVFVVAGASLFMKRDA